MLLTNEKLDHECDDLADMGRHGSVVAVHLIDDCLQQMCHSLQHLILQSLHIFLHFLMLIYMDLALLGLG